MLIAASEASRGLPVPAASCCSLFRFPGLSLFPTPRSPLALPHHFGGRMGPEGLMVSVSGIRGRVGAGLTPEVVTSYASAFGSWATARDSSKPVVVGRDSRVSGPMFHRSVVAALQSVGARVIDLGLTTTPTCQLAVEHHHAAGGLMISASHNPIEWNALKFVGPSGLFLDALEGAAMRALVGQPFPRAAWERLGIVEADDEAPARH